MLTDPRLGPFASKKAEPPVPVNLTRLIGNAKKTFKVNMNKASELKPLDIVNKVKGLLAELEVVKVVGNDTLSKEAQFNATYNFFAMVRSTLSSNPNPNPNPNPSPNPNLTRCASGAVIGGDNTVDWRDELGDAEGLAALSSTATLDSESFYPQKQVRPTPDP